MKVGTQLLLLLARDLVEATITIQMADLVDDLLLEFS